MWLQGSSSTASTLDVVIHRSSPGDSRIGLFLQLAPQIFARAIDDGWNALLTSGLTVQNSYSPRSERGPSITDQRNRLVFSSTAELQPFHREHELLGRLFNDWRFSGDYTYGSGRPLDARIFGDPNQDLNDMNDRLPGMQCISRADYATTDMRTAQVVCRQPSQIGTDGRVLQPVQSQP